MENKTIWVKVTSFVSYKMEYMVEVPEGHPEYALDTVTRQEAVEYHQEFLDENVSTFTIPYKLEDAIRECKGGDKNTYCSSWSDEQIIKAFFNPMGKSDV